MAEVEQPISGTTRSVSRASHGHGFYIHYDRHKPFTTVFRNAGRHGSIMIQNDPGSFFLFFPPARYTRPAMRGS